MRKIIVLLFCFISFTSILQVNVPGTSYTHFQLKNKRDTIDFVIADTNLNLPKPLFLFCQGSLPVPLFFKFEGHGVYPTGLNNFDLAKLNENYHVVVISMPKTPLIVGPNHLNKRYCFVTDTSHQNSFLDAYLRADYAENYKNRANKVIQFLLKQDWVLSNKVIVAGHSQGARVAVEIGASNKAITHLGLFSYNPLPRIHHPIMQIRKEAESGTISWEKADTLQQKYYDLYANALNEDSLKTQPSLISWNSFSNPTLEKIIKLKIPIYIANGSEDSGTDFCDLLPLYFIENGNKNYTIKRYPNLEHNFFPLNEDGRADHKNGKWITVMNAFTEWIDLHPKP